MRLKNYGRKYLKKKVEKKALNGLSSLF